MTEFRPPYWPNNSAASRNRTPPARRTAAISKPPSPKSRPHPRKRYTENTRFTYVRFELNYKRGHFVNLPAEKFAKALRAENIPFYGGLRVYSHDCPSAGMLDVHLNSRGFERVFSKARLKEYRDRLTHLDIDRKAPAGEMLYMDSKIPLLATQKEMDQIVAAFQKIAANADRIASA